MISLPKIIGMMSYSFVLVMSLSATQAAESVELSPCADSENAQPNQVKCEEETPQGIHTIKGEILHMNGANLLVKRSDGKEVILHVDLSTQMSEHVGPGDRIEANVNQVEDESHAVSIRRAE
jgi:hypothetical protein